jgi:hypothetical protein
MPKTLAVLCILTACSTLASADSVGVGVFTFDLNTPTASATFDITNLTGSNAFAPDFPVTTPLTLTITSLVATLDGGGTLNLNGSVFSIVDPQGDLNCAVPGDAGSGGCNFSAYNLVSATITGTFSPVTGITGLPGGATDISSTFTTTITPNAGCGPSGGTATTLTAGCDSAVIYATSLTVSAVPEPASWQMLLLATLWTVILAIYKRKQLLAWIQHFGSRQR